MNTWNRLFKTLWTEAPVSAMTESDPDFTGNISQQSWLESLRIRYITSPGAKSETLKTKSQKAASLTVTAIAHTVSPGNRSFVNAANLASGVGVLVNHWGSKNIDNPKGIIGIGVGRSIDILDGKLARALNQESEFGKMLDHSLDKLAMADILYHAWKKNVGPKSALAAIAILNTANALITVANKVLDPDKELSPTKSGKLSITLQALTIGAFMFEKQTEQSYQSAPTVFRFIGRLTFGASLALGAHSTLQYARLLTERSQNTLEP